MGNNIWKIWKTTRKQQGNEWKTCGDNWKANSGKQIGIVKGFNMRAILRRQTTRQHMEEPWRQSEDSIWETTYARQLRGHIYLGERWKTTEEQQEWETTQETTERPYVGDRSKTIKQQPDRETTARNHIWETTGRPHLGKRWKKTKQLPDQGPISGKPNLGDNWETICGR